MASRYRAEYQGLTKRWVFAIALLALTVLAPFNAQACGTIQIWMTKYNNAGPSDVIRRSALRELAGNCHGYIAKQNDQKLLAIIADALERGLSLKSVQRVFETFRCLPSATGDAKYTDLSKVLDMSNCPTPKEMKSWYVVVVDQAIIRRRPNKSSGKAGWVAHGTVVKASGEAGNWLKVTDWRGQDGFIYKPLLQNYLLFEASN